VSAPEPLDLTDLPDEYKALLHKLVAYRLQVIGEVTTMLRRTPRYDRDYPQLIRAARRIEEWASQ
jgi:hypothetical protein